MLDQAPLAEEVVQDAFLRVWQRADTFDLRRGDNVRAWLMTIVHNRALDMHRRSAGKQPMPLDLDAVDGLVSSPDPAAEVFRNLDRERVLANYALGVRPANDVAFEAKQFATVGDAAAALKQLGFIGGSGTSVSYPGPIDPAQFKNLVTNTTPGGPAVDCVAMTMPNTGAGTAAATTLSSGHDLDQTLGLFALFGVGGGTLLALSRRLANRAKEQADA